MAMDYYNKPPPLPQGHVAVFNPYTGEWILTADPVATLREIHNPTT